MKKRLVGVLILLIGCFPFLIAQNEIINSSENITTPQTITIPYFETFSSTTLPPLWSTAPSGLISCVNMSYLPPAVALSEDAMIQMSVLENSPNIVRYLISPEFSNLSTGTVVNFWFFRHIGLNNYPGSMSVYANSTTDTSNAVLLTTIPRVYSIMPSVPSPGWYKYTATLPADTFKFIIFKFYSDNSANMYLDEISVTEPIECNSVPANSLTIQNFTSNTISLKWQKGGNETTWEVAYKKTTDLNWNYSISNDTIYTITNLNPSNTYQVKVRGICPQGGNSLWTFQKRMFTVCDPIQSIPYLMTFDSTNIGSIPECYQTLLDPNATIQTATLSGNDRVLDFCSYNIDRDCILILPPFQDSINSLRVKFKAVAVTPYYSTYHIGYLTDYTDPDSFVYLSSGTISVNNWYSCDFNTLTSLTGNERFAIEIRSYVNSHAKIDSVMVVYPEPCLPPQRLKSYHVETYQATLDWSPSPYGVPADYDLQYRDLNSPNWILIPNVNPPFILSGLSPVTSYAFKVKSNCSPNITQYSQLDTFTTHCVPISYEYLSETFESMLPNSCWELKSGYLLDTGNAIIEPSTFGWDLSNTFGPYTAVANLSMFDHFWLITPPIDLGNSSDPKQLEFDVAVTDENNAEWANLPQSPNARFVVLVSTDYGETWNKSGIIKEWNNHGGTPFNTLNNTLRTQVVSLYDSLTMSNYTGIVQIAFYSYIVDFNWGYTNDIHLDNIIINPQSNCIKPRGINATYISTNTMQLNWTPSSTPTSYILEYGPEGFIHGNGTTIQTTQNSITLNTLQHSTSYDFYVKSVCSVGDTSVWSFKKTLSTLCLATPFPFSDTFNSSGFPICWRQSYSGEINDNVWSLSHTNLAGGTTNELKFSKMNGNGTSRLISPAINFTGVNDAVLIFKYFLDANDVGPTFKIQISPNLVTWTDQPFSINLGTVNIGPTTVAIPLSNLNGIRYIAWVVEGEHYYIDALYIDDIQINATSSYCPPPTNVLATSLNATTAEVTWTPVGTETQWEFAYKQSSSSTWITNITNAPTYTIDSLTTTTSYTIKVRAICDQVQSPYSNPVTYTHLQTYSIFTTHDANCSINPTGVLVVPQGSDTTFHFSANAGYIVSEVRVDGVVLNPTPTSYTFENISSNHEINLFSLLSNNVNENSPLFVQLMPNPAHSFIELKVDINLLKSNIGKIYNFYGQNVKELMINNEKMVIDISDLSVGVYLVFLETKQGIYTIKFVKD